MRLMRSMRLMMRSLRMMLFLELEIDEIEGIDEIVENDVVS